MAGPLVSFSRPNHTPGASALEMVARAIGHDRRKRGSQRDYEKIAEDTPAYYQAFAESWLRYRQRFESEWQFLDREYNIGRDVNENMRFFRNRGERGEAPEVLGADIYALTHHTEAMITGNRPKFFIEGHTAELDNELANTFELMLNNEWTRNFRLYKEAKLCVRDCSRKSFGVMLTTIEDQMGGARRRMAKNGVRATGLSEDPVIASAMAQDAVDDAARRMHLEEANLREGFEGDPRALTGRIASRRISPWNFMFDPDCYGLDHMCRVLGRLILVDEALIKSMDGLENVDRLEAMSRGDLRRLVGSDSTSDWKTSDADHLPWNTVPLYEMFIHRPGGQWDYVLLPVAGDFYLKQIENCYWIGHGYSMLQWNDDGEGMIAMSDAQAIMSNVFAKRALMTKLVEGHAREQSGITFYDKRLGISDVFFHEYTDEAVERLVPCDPPTDGRPLQTAFYQPPKHAKSPDSLNILEMINRNMGEAVGLSQNAMGQALKSGTTATEAAEVAANSRGRGSHKLGAMEEFLSNIAYQRLGLMIQKYTGDEVLRFAGRKAAETWEANEEYLNEDFVKDLLLVRVEPGVDGAEGRRHPPEDEHDSAADGDDQPLRRPGVRRAQADRARGTGDGGKRWLGDHPRHPRRGRPAHADASRHGCDSRGRGPKGPAV